MKKIQYQGMNLFDQIATVEITYDERNRRVHLYDPTNVIWPEYRGQQNGYVLSEGFLNMSKVLGRKMFFGEIRSKNESEYLAGIQWFFYKPNTHILVMDKQQIFVWNDDYTECIDEHYTQRCNVY